LSRLTNVGISPDDEEPVTPVGIRRRLNRKVMTPGELGRRLHLTSGVMTALLTSFGRHPTDRGGVVLSASAAILARIAELYAPLVADVDALTAELSDRDQQLVHRCLEAIVALSEA
jgi:DNA-binding MarR family transcriptional regulator